MIAVKISDLYFQIDPTNFFNSVFPFALKAQGWLAGKIYNGLT